MRIKHSLLLAIVAILAVGLSAIGKDSVFASSDLVPDQSGWIIQTVDSTDDVGQYNSLALHLATGDPRVSYYDATRGNLKYAAWHGTAWQVQVVDDAENVGQYSSLALDPVTGDPRISYYDAVSQSLKYAAWDGVAWQIEVVDDSGDSTGQYCSLALDPVTGDPRISYQHCLSGQCCLRYAAWQPASSTWVSETVDCSWGDTGRYTSLAMDPSSGDPRISYQRVEFDGDLQYTAFDGAIWQSTTLALTGDRGHFSSLALDPDTGYPRVMDFYPSVNATFLSAWDGSEWHTSIITYGGSEGYGTLMLDTSAGPTRGYPRISHRSRSHTGRKLLYTIWDGAAWQEETAFDGARVAYTSLALNPMTADPRISFYGKDSNNLKIAVWQNSICDNALNCLQGYFINQAGAPPNARSSEWGVYHDYTGQPEGPQGPIVEGASTTETQMLAFNFQALMCILQGDCAGRDGTYSYLRRYLLPQDGVNDQPHDGPYQPPGLSHWLIDVDGGTVIPGYGTMPPNTPYLAWHYPPSVPPEAPDRPAYVSSGDYEYAVAPDADQWWVEGLCRVSAYTPTTEYSNLAQTIVDSLAILLTGDDAPCWTPDESYPGVMQFSLRWNQDGENPWVGPLYTGYQAPAAHYLAGERSVVSQMITFLRAAQLAYDAQEPGQANLGPFMPIFIQDTQYSNEAPPRCGWTWDGGQADPNTDWAQFQYRAFAHVAHYYYLSGDPAAGQITQDFRAWMKSQDGWIQNPANFILPYTLIPDSEDVVLGYSPGNFGLAAQGLIYLAARDGDPAVKADAELILHALATHQNQVEEPVGAFPAYGGERYYGYENAEAGIALGLYELLLADEAPPRPETPGLACQDLCNVADVDNSGIVDIADIIAVASGWQNPGFSVVLDIDGNGVVDILDIMIVASHWQSECP